MERENIYFAVEYKANWVNLVTVLLVGYTRYGLKGIVYCSSIVAIRDRVKWFFKCLCEASVVGDTTVSTGSHAFTSESGTD